MKKQKRFLITKHKMSILYSLIVKKRRQKTEIQRIEILDNFFNLIIITALLLVSTTALITDLVMSNSAVAHPSPATINFSCPLPAIFDITK